MAHDWVFIWKYQAIHKKKMRSNIIINSNTMNKAFAFYSLFHKLIYVDDVVITEWMSKKDGNRNK